MSGTARPASNPASTGIAWHCDTGTSPVYPAGTRSAAPPGREVAYLQGDQIIIVPTPKSAALTYRLFYYPLPSELFGDEDRVSIPDEFRTVFVLDIACRALNEIKEDASALDREKDMEWERLRRDAWRTQDEPLIVPPCMWP